MITADEIKPEKCHLTGQLMFKTFEDNIMMRECLMDVQKDVIRNSKKCGKSFFEHVQSTFIFSKCKHSDY